MNRSTDGWIIHIIKPDGIERYVGHDGKARAQPEKVTPHKKERAAKHAADRFQKKNPTWKVAVGRIVSNPTSPLEWTPFSATESPNAFVNSRYHVIVTELPESPWGPMVHLSIKRNDRAAVHDWRDLQRIKNELVGPENEAVELYPAESRLADTSNQYHLWCLAEDAKRFPFGYEGRAVVAESIPGMTVQRPLEEAPVDALSAEEAKAAARTAEEIKAAGEPLRPPMNSPDDHPIGA